MLDERRNLARRPPGARVHRLQLRPQGLAVEPIVTHAAHAAWRDDSTGSLSVGKYADLILLDRDLYSIAPHEIGATEVLLTLLEGQEVHRHARFVG
ncbi:amidohydrolase family protein [Pseudomonas guariconensis]|uniref:amidohydrolase family protein n=1 Tax=Pseudomonas guariconensis TaxID=1288410 RepID=UPI0018A8B217|nr:amidohydrolase family protein [Pseudomonas guariconensis]MBF8753805.1 amidohydrolase family protein [Pseudomonas guariconensis]